MMLFEGLTTGIAPGFYLAPPFYFSNPHAVAGTNDDVAITPGAELFDYELEIGAVIGEAGSDLTVEEARAHIIGYTIFNDWTGRDVLLREIKSKLGPVKAKDTTNTLGPWLVTADELEGHRNAEGFLDLTMRVWLNGTLMGTDTLANSSWAFEDLVALASRGTWVRPADLIGSGTCGSGCLAESWGRHGLDSQRALIAGDEVTMEVEGIGQITNRVVEGAALKPFPRGRARRTTGTQ
jgi:2-keto-4-pentenoate hydratase/2-oxohepta-3-ene-1,7-dioic acid hydratase in catechol pathway